MDLEKVWVLPGVRPGEIQVSHPSKCLFKTSSPLSHPLNAITTQLMPLNLRGCVYSQGRSWEFGTGRLPSQRHLVYLRLFKRGRFEETQSKWPFHWASPKWNASQPKAEWLQSDFRGEGFLLVHAHIQYTHPQHYSVVHGGVWLAVLRREHRFSSLLSTFSALGLNPQMTPSSPPRKVATPSSPQTPDSYTFTNIHISWQYHGEAPTSAWTHLRCWHVKYDIGLSLSAKLNVNHQVGQVRDTRMEKKKKTPTGLRGETSARWSFIHHGVKCGFIRGWRTMSGEISSREQKGAPLLKHQH